MFIQRKYNTATVTGSHIRVPMIKRGLADFALGADWTPAAGDVKVSKDGGAAANIGTLPNAVAVGNSAYWEFPLSAAELSCKQLVVTIADGSPKAVEDNIFVVETFGNAAAMIPVDLSDSVRFGLSALPAAAAAANGGLPTVDGSNRVAGIQGAKTTFDSLNDLSALQAADAVLDADVAAHHTAAGSAGERINAGGTAGDPWAAALPGSYGVGTAGSIVGNGLDAPVSTRLPSASYAAPNNSGIAAIKAKTDNLPANPAAAGGAVTLDMSQIVPLTNLPQSVGDALNAARAQGFGPWALSGDVCTLFAADGITPVHAFTWDDPDNPTSRM